MQPTSRPVYLNLLRIHLPVTAWVSILHRVTGALLFASLPFLVWGFSLAMRDEAGFAQVAAWLSSPICKLLALVWAWVFAHHFFAGLRHLAMDVDVGLDLPTARRSSVAVFVAGALVAVWIAWVLFA
jgi:succinate dehydrogenase / fumarate reductase cytochrome b subunit